MTAIWLSTKRRDEFFSRLDALIHEYPELHNVMAREYSDDPSADYWDSGCDIPNFDPNAAVFQQGVVLLISTSNVDNWEDLVITGPLRQSQYMTAGMIHAAMNLMGTGH